MALVALLGKQCLPLNLAEKTTNKEGNQGSFKLVK